MNPEVTQYLQAWSDENIAPPPAAALIGARLSGFGDGMAEIDLDASARLHNPFGTVQGGILCAAADVAMGVAAATALNPGEGFTTVTMNSTFFKALSAGALKAIAKVVHRGRSTVVVECDIHGDGEVIARMSSTCLIRAGFGLRT